MCTFFMSWMLVKIQLVSTNMSCKCTDDFLFINFFFFFNTALQFKYCSFTHARMYSVGHYGLVITIHKHLASLWIINVNEHCLILQTFILWPILRMGINTHTSGGSSTVMTTWWHITTDTIESQFFLQCSLTVVSDVFNEGFGVGGWDIHSVVFQVPCVTTWCPWGGGAGRLSPLLSQVVNLLDQAASYRFGFRR